MSIHLVELGRGRFRYESVLGGGMYTHKLFSSVLLVCRRRVLG